MMLEKAVGKNQEVEKFQVGNQIGRNEVGNLTDYFSTSEFSNFLLSN